MPVDPEADVVASALQIFSWDKHPLASSRTVEANVLSIDLYEHVPGG